MRTPCPACFLFLIPLASAGQNLVPNPGFETFAQCPVGFSQFDGFVSTWSDPSTASPDYYNGCAGTFPAGVPRNGNGYQLPHGGQAYAGAYMTAGDYREFLQVRLTSALVAGHEYLVRFYVVLHDRSATATDDLGAYLSVTPPSSTGTGLLNGEPVPQVRNAFGNVLMDTLQWTPVSGSFTAQGGERYLTLGHFAHDAQTTYTDTGFGPQGGYYYFDDASVTEVDPLPVELVGLTAEGGDRVDHVAWSTATEQNNAGFDLQRSMDASTFTSLAWIGGAGDAVELHEYAYDDKEVVPGTTYYYRLRQLDLNGESTLSPIVSATPDGTGVLDLRPAAQGHLQVVMPAAGDLRIDVLDVLGRCCARWDGMLPEGPVDVDLDRLLPDHATGIELVHCSAGGREAVMRLLR